MPLTNDLANLVTRIGTEFKAFRGKLGDLNSLSTTEKGSLVGALNELAGGLEAGGTVTVDAITDASPTTKNFLKATDATAARGVIGAGTSNLTLGTTPTTAKPGDYQPTWLEVTSKPVVIAAGGDAAAARSAIDVPSVSEVDTRISNLIGSAPAALDTFQEIAARIEADSTGTAGIVTSLGKRVAVDEVQNFTEQEKLQGRNNIDVYSKAEIGNIEIDLVAAFEAALV